MDFRIRDYQHEMFERSMKGNVIVAMDTGSGKTAIAVLRIRAELDRCSPKKRIWFMAPTVQLCMQQHDYIRSHIPAAATRLLVGSDNVDRWSEQRIWDVVLEGVQIIVSTHAVLGDALDHGFVKISELALLIFDEAHHCIRGHKANRIMQDFYHCQKEARGSDAVPHILGLSASPILRSKLSELNIIESNLDALSITPRRHRKELLDYVHHPVFQKLDYVPRNPNDGVIDSQALRVLKKVLDTVQMEHNHSSLNMTVNVCDVHESHPHVGRKVEWVEQMLKFHRKATHIYEELGAWAADYFISQTIDMLRNKSTLSDKTSTSLSDGITVPVLRALNKQDVIQPPHELNAQSFLSSKVQMLFSFLEMQDPREHSGLIFVRQRAVVGILYKMLTSHPRTAGRFRCSTFVGMSNSLKRKYTMFELFDWKAQQHTMAEFRAGRKNLIIATDVLEEGIDVTACNLVICFDPPPTLKSFIQRRGRARMEQSKFAIMLPLTDSGSKIKYWQQLEKELIKTYQDEERVRQEAVSVEDEEEEMNYTLHVKNTGATLTANSTKAHLYHFCAKLPRQPYIDIEPEFSFVESPSGLFKATVTLPSCVTSSVRSISGKKAWKTESAATKDAAFQCYSALYDAGLLNDNLLPLSHDWQDDLEIPEKLPATVMVDTQIMSSIQMNIAWTSPDFHQTKVLVHTNSFNNVETLSMIITTPAKIVNVPPLTLYWNAETTFMITFDPSVSLASPRSESLDSMREITQLLHQATHSDRTKITETDFVFLFTPAIEEDKLVDWLASNRGRRNIFDIDRENQTHIEGLVRVPSLHGSPHVFCNWRFSSEGEEEEEVLGIECTPLLRRRNFEVPNTLSMKSTCFESDSLSRTKLFTRECTIDFLNFNYARFNLFIPAILRHIDAYTVAYQLQRSILTSVGIKNVQHIVTAITAPSANSVTNYQRYEFIGDAVLKFVTSVQLYADHCSWPEGYLSQRRDSLVSNNTLANAALHKRLEFYVLTEASSQRKWSPPRISDEITTNEKRGLAVKVLADVVEALIGAAFIDSGIQAARSCINVFLPEIRIRDFKIPRPPGNDRSSMDIRKAESLVGYKFSKKLLLEEALTHGTYAAIIVTESYQRLEFLGDAILDYLVVNQIFQHTPALSQGQMTGIKAALVNASMLGFLCMDYSVNRNIILIEEQLYDQFVEVRSTEKLQLWRYMRYHSEAIQKMQKACSERYELYYLKIRNRLEESVSYPWALLARLSPDKFYSDTIESVIGAIFVDSGGSLSECQRFIDRIGLTLLARRMANPSFDVVHPKPLLQHLAGAKRIEFATESYEQIENASLLFRCTVLIDGSKIAEVDGCNSTDEAVVVGADAAVTVLSSERKDISSSHCINVIN